MVSETWKEQPRDKFLKDVLIIVMILGDSGNQVETKLNKKKIEQTDSFKYLRVRQEWKMGEDIINRIESVEKYIMLKLDSHEETRDYDTGIQEVSQVCQRKIL